MNQTTTGCANCYYSSNGRCFYGAPCYGAQIMYTNGEWVSVPIADCEKLKKEVVGRTTELTIKCKEFMPKEQLTIKR